MKKFLIGFIFVSLVTACGSAPPPPPPPAPTATPTVTQPANSWGANFASEVQNCTNYQLSFAMFPATEAQWKSFCTCYFNAAASKYPQFNDYVTYGYFQLQQTNQQTMASCMKSSGLN